MDFAELARVFEKFESTRKRLEITGNLAELFKKTRASEVRHLIYLCQGIIAPQYEGIELGIGERLAMQSISLVSGKKVEEIEKVYRKTGDLGEAAQEVLKQKLQRTLAREALTVEKVFDRFCKIATSSGEGSQGLKIKLLAELLSNAEPNEAKTIVKIVVGNLRLGIGEPTILDALSVMKAGDKSLRPELDRAYNLRSDLGFVAEDFFKHGIEELRKAKPEVFYPINPALAERLTTAEEIIEKIGACAVEAKYDGLRLQVHRKGDKIEIYSRRLERVTRMFPDVVDAVKKQVNSRDIIFEGEAVAYDEKRKRFLPFQKTIRRKRKYEIEEKIKEIPLKLFAFELLYCNGRDYTNDAYESRRRELEKLVKRGQIIEMAEMRLVKTSREVNELFQEFVSRGLEGIIAKDLKQPYVAGARKFAWIKLKKSYGGELADTIDAVIVGYYEGKGKRTQFGFGGFLCAVWDDKQRVFKTICRVGTGFTEEEMKEFAKLLLKISVKEKPKNVLSLVEPSVWVQPKVVVTLNADEITRSPMHTCGMQQVKEGEIGLALRFPRFMGIRKDKSPEQATSETEVFEMLELQKQRK